jgi:hypothetical protein
VDFSALQDCVLERAVSPSLASQVAGVVGGRAKNWGWRYLSKVISAALIQGRRISLAIEERIQEVPVVAGSCITGAEFSRVAADVSTKL